MGLMASKLKNVSYQTLDDENKEGAKLAMESLNKSQKTLPNEITKENDIMNFAVTGTDEQWKDALKGEDPTSMTNVQIATETEKKVLPRIDEKEIQEESNRSIPGNKRNNPS